RITFVKIQSVRLRDLKIELQGHRAARNGDGRGEVHGALSCALATIAFIPRGSVKTLVIEDVGELATAERHRGAGVGAFGNLHGGERLDGAVEANEFGTRSVGER